MINVFSDATFQILLNAGYRIITMFPHPEISIHYIFEDIRSEEDVVVVQGFSITEFLELHRNQNSAAAVLGLLTAYLERNKTVTLRLHKIPYISHASI